MKGSELMPTFTDYPGVSWIQNKCPSPPYSSPNLPEKANLDYFFFIKDDKSSTFYLQIKNIGFTFQGWFYIFVKFYSVLHASISATFSLWGRLGRSPEVVNLKI